MTKLLFLIADGMGDYPIDELGGKTPLAAAATPNMDALGKRCAAGLCRTIPAGMPPGSDTANMSLLGFDPVEFHTGRGPIEAAAQGLDLAPDDLVFRLNLVTISEATDNGFMLDYSAGHIETKQAAKLIDMLQSELGGEGYEFIAGVQYRHLLVQKGGGAEPEADLHIHPPHDITDKSIAPDLATYRHSAGLKRIVEGAAELLGRPENVTKANAVWPWGQGKALTLPSFEELYGLRGAVISAVDLVKGLGRASGMEVIEVPGATGLLDTNYAGKAEAALDFLRGGGDFVYLHVEAPDECGHAGNCMEKMEAIRRFDDYIVGPLTLALENDAAYLLACDHFTPVAEKTHTSEPVPFLLHAPGITEHTLTHFDENTAAGTGLLIEPGHLLMKWVVARL